MVGDYSAIGTIGCCSIHGLNYNSNSSFYCHNHSWKEVGFDGGGYGDGWRPFGGELSEGTKSLRARVFDSDYVSLSH